MPSEQQALAVHWKAMVRSACGVLGSRDEAEECAGAALLQACERDLDEVQDLEAFLVTMAKRRALDRLRSIERARRRDARLAALEDVVVPDIAEAVASRSEARHVARLARDALDDRSFEVLRRHADGDDMVDVAASLGLTVAATRSVLHRARKLVRSLHAGLAALLGVVCWGAKRAAGPATVAASAAALLLTLPVTGSTAEGAAAGAGEQPAVFRRPAAPPTAVARSPQAGSVRLAAVPPGSGAVPTTRRSPARQVARLDAPLGAQLSLTREHHGSAGTQGPVRAVVECAENLRVTASYLGC